jgi:hypothetical protein
MSQQKWPVTVVGGKKHVRVDWAFNFEPEIGIAERVVTKAMDSERSEISHHSRLRNVIRAH